MNLKNIPKKIIFFAILLCLLNLFDAGATTFLLTTGLGMELNPVMAWLIEQGIGYFWAFKLSIGTVAPYVLAKHHQNIIARRGLYVMASLYGALFVYYMCAFATMFL